AIIQFRNRRTARFFAGVCIGPDPLVRLDPSGAKRPTIAVPATEEFGIARRRGPNERDLAASLLEQVGRRIEAALLVVRGHRGAELTFGPGSPAHEMCA